MFIVKSVLFDRFKISHYFWFSSHIGTLCLQTRLNSIFRQCTYVLQGYSSRMNDNLPRAQEEFHNLKCKSILDQLLFLMRD